MTYQPNQSEDVTLKAAGAADERTGLRGLLTTLEEGYIAAGEVSGSAFLAGESKSHEQRRLTYEAACRTLGSLFCAVDEAKKLLAAEAAGAAPGVSALPPLPLEAHKLHDEHRTLVPLYTAEQMRDYAARALLAAPGAPTCPTCGANAPFTGSCGTSESDTKALCRRAPAPVAVTLEPQPLGWVESEWSPGAIVGRIFGRKVSDRHIPVYAAPVSPSPAEELMEQPKEGSVHSAAMEVAESWDAGFREDALWESVEKLAAAVHAHSAAPEKIAGPDATLEQVMDAVADMHVHQAAPSGDVPFGVHSGQVGENAPRAGGSAPHGVDWIGLALDLEAQAKRVESQTAERAMRAAANGLRLMGRAA